MTTQIARDLNTVVRFLAAPEIIDLEPSAVEEQIGNVHADLLILLGNSVLHTMDAVAQAYHSGVVDDLFVVGGRGHSTPHLRKAIRTDPRYDGHPIDEDSEAEILQGLLVRWHGIDESAITVGTESTNCGANAEEAYDLLAARSANPADVLLVQDPTLQRRTWASFRRVWGEARSPRFHNAPTFIPTVRVGDGTLDFEIPERAGLWSMERFLSLVMGEIPRLRNDEHGYGPNGRGFIVSVEIPSVVEAAYDRLLGPFEDYVRSPG